MTNILKYSFNPEDEDSIVFNAYSMENRIVIEISDNGSGLPESFDIKNSDGF